MDSNILEKIGLGELDPAYYIIGLLVICIGLFVYTMIVNKKLNEMQRKYKKFMGGKDGKSLESVIMKRFDQIDDLMANDREMDDRIEKITDNLMTVFQKIGIVKYDAFNEMGGKLSFAIALLDKEDTGFVMNAMHSREGCYLYIKEIIKGESYIMLGEEEKEAVEKAMDYDNFMN